MVYKVNQACRVGREYKVPKDVEGVPDHEDETVSVVLQVEMEEMESKDAMVAKDVTGGKEETGGKGETEEMEETRVGVPRKRGFNGEEDLPMMS